MIKIKNTKSLEMFGDEEVVTIHVHPKGWAKDEIVIPARVVFQLIRGLITWDQKFYRKPIKHIKHL